MYQLTGILFVCASASAQLTLSGVRCHELKCSLNEYCSPETDRCAPCSEVCNRTGRNFDEDLCVKECQGYIHDMQYPSERSLAAEVAAAQHQARIALVISCVSLAALALVLVTLCLRVFRNKLTFKYLRQLIQPSKNRVKQHPTDLVHHNPHAEMPKPKNETKLNLRNPEPPKRNLQPLNVNDLDNRTSGTDKSLGATTPKTTLTSLSRHPAEDATLDYSYDNQALNVAMPDQPTATASHHF